MSKLKILKKENFVLKDLGENKELVEEVLVLFWVFIVLWL